MKHRKICLTLSAILLLTTLLAALPLSAAAEDIVMEPMHGEPFQPEGVTFGRVSFIVPGGTQGLTKDAWDDRIEHNTQLTPSFCRLTDFNCCLVFARMGKCQKNIPFVEKGKMQCRLI